MAHAALTDESIKSPVRLLSDALRELLDASPSDAVPDQPAGTILVDRAYYPEVGIEDVEGTMISVLPGPMACKPGARGKNRYEEEVYIFVQQKLENEPKGAAGKAELDAFLDFVHRVVTAISVGPSRKVTDTEANEHDYLANEQTDILDQHLAKGFASVRIDADYEVVHMSFAAKSRNAAFRGFFDRKKIEREVGRVEARKLNQVGGLTRKIARRSLRKRKHGISVPGQPPFSHGPRHLLRNNIFYFFDKSKGRVMIGPVKLNTQVSHIVPKTLEIGGTVRGRGFKDGKVRTVSMRFNSRPFMKPAHDKAAKKFPAMFRNSL